MRRIQGVVMGDGDGCALPFLGLLIEFLPCSLPMGSDAVLRNWVTSSDGIGKGGVRTALGWAVFAEPRAIFGGDQQNLAPVRILLQGIDLMVDRLPGIGSSCFC